MVISLKLKLIDKVNGLKYMESSEQGHWYNKAVFSACQRIDEFFNDELVPEVPKYVADWYESDKKNLDYNLWNYVYWDSNHALFMVKSEEYNGEEALAEIFEDYTYPIMVVGNIWEEEE